MIRFLGNIEVRADAKGRVFIPATFRKQLQAASEERLIMRKDVFQDCLTLYPESVWNEELNELRSRLNMGQRTGRTTVHVPRRVRCSIRRDYER